MTGKLWKGVPLAALLALAPATYSAGTGVRAADAECQTGRCCPESGSTCVISGVARDNQYYSPTQCPEWGDDYGNWPLRV